jgi:hypothetical protein
MEYVLITQQIEDNRELKHLGCFWSDSISLSTMCSLSWGRATDSGQDEVIQKTRGSGEGEEWVLIPVRKNEKELKSGKTVW